MIPCLTPRTAIEKLDWYAMRWKIETFHKVLKFGSNAEEARLRTAERLASLIATFSILSFANQLTGDLSEMADLKASLGG